MTVLAMAGDGLPAHRVHDQFLMQLVRRPSWQQPPIW